MRNAQELLHTIAGAFHIERGKRESTAGWEARVIYSLLGRMAYASLWDHLEGDEEAPGDVSILHIRRRVQGLLESCLELYPETAPLFSADSEGLCREIYELYLKTGCVYHTPYRVLQAAPSMARQSGLQFERGMPLSRNQYLSGLGAYLPEGSAFGAGRVYASVGEMFGLLEGTLADFWRDLVAAAEWRPLYAEEDMEYLSHNGSQTWQRTPPKGVCLARTGQPGGYLYALYQAADGEKLGSQLPQWLVNDAFYGGMSYFTAASAYFAANACLPKIRYTTDGGIVRAGLPRFFPPPERYWFKLYSWPQLFSCFPNDFTRVFSLEVFQAVKPVLEGIGYQFAEG